MKSFELRLKPVLTTSVTGVATAMIGLSPVTAFAHWGHLGELAGHGHLVAAGLAAAAVAVAGLAVIKPQDAPSTSDDAEAEESTNAGEQANA